MDIGKPKLTTEDQVKHLVAKGVKFTIVSEDDATSYLRQNNNYFKLTAYRKNFPKHFDGPFKGKYYNLEFAQLQDLAIIDMRLRYLLMHMALDIEHFTKVMLLLKIEVAPDEDGYAIVADFRDSLGAERQKKLNSEIDRNGNNAYCGAIVRKYADKYPVWAFMEIIPFGRLVYFCRFCAERFGDAQVLDHHFRLLSVLEVRNAAAHSSCILNDLAPAQHERINYQVARALSDITELSRQARKRKMSNVRLRQIVTLLFVHKQLVKSTGVAQHTHRELQRFQERMLKNRGFYDNNDMIATSFDFLKKVIDSWFPVV